ncbi:hypothetical protein [Flavobacterium eburneipallidum]|uniref:hypothetical protein n=1 Tax=Flavobacterium eburneipallidum TaxID=3003263 RepID=UPI0024824580|nr:hypothetical protein [Flavobacterium eburneipallidum]
MSDADLTVFYQEAIASPVRCRSCPAFRYKSSQKKVKFPVLKRASVGRFFRTGNFTFFAPGFPLQSGLGYSFSESYFVLQMKFVFLINLY